MNANMCFAIFVILSLILVAVIAFFEKTIYINDDIYTFTNVYYKGKPALVLVKVFSNESYIAVVEPFDSKM